MKPQHRWHVAECLFKSVRESGPAWNPVVERLLFLVDAPDSAAAVVKAEKLGREKEHTYNNAHGDRIHWEFIALIAVKEMIDPRLEDGAEVISWMSGGEFE
jgi:hypothetical protein